MGRAWTRSSQAYDNQIEIVGRSREVMRRGLTPPSKSNEPPVEGPSCKEAAAKRQGGTPRLSGIHPVHKVSIIPRGVGRRLHHANTLHKIRFLLARRDFENRLTVLNAGRAAEALIFDCEDLDRRVR